jgi:hypothetical protein
MMKLGNVGKVDIKNLYRSVPKFLSLPLRTIMKPKIKGFTLLKRKEKRFLIDCRMTMLVLGTVLEVVSLF